MYNFPVKLQDLGGGEASDLYTSLVGILSIWYSIILMY